MTIMDAKEARPVDDPKALVSFGWAPGGYYCVSCASCGQSHSGSDKRSSRCQDCAEALRDAQPVETPSNANTSGLEVVAWRKNVWVAEGIGTGWMLSNEQPEPNHQPTDIEPLVTAASAQERIAELEALVSKSCDLSVEQTDKLLAMHDRATAAEARADRLAKALEPFAVMAGAGDQRPKDDAVWAGQDGLRITYGDFRAARAALQQETQP